VKRSGHWFQKISQFRQHKCVCFVFNSFNSLQRTIPQNRNSCLKKTPFSYLFP
jgi:hypothetical protein